jgi:hypothetical protein
MYELRDSPAGGVLPVTQGLEIPALNSHPATLNFLSGRQDDGASLEKPEVESEG